VDTAQKFAICDLSRRKPKWTPLAPRKVRIVARRRTWPIRVENGREPSDDSSQSLTTGLDQFKEELQKAESRDGRAVLDLRGLKFTDPTASIDDSLGRDLVADRRVQQPADLASARSAGRGRCNASFLEVESRTACTCMLAGRLSSRRLLPGWHKFRGARTEFEP
jgi:hypothetical protein